MLIGWLILAVVLLVVGALLIGITLLWMAMMLLRPPRMRDGKAVYVLKRISPGDLGMQFDEMRFVVRNEHDGGRIDIAAWWIPHSHSNGRCVFIIHGYADGKIGAIAWAPTWQALGYNILAIDLRAHGYSGGRYTTAGFFERHDLNQIINQIRAERPGETRHIVLFGISLGAAVALASAETRDDIDALVLECPFADYRRPVIEHAKLMGMPLPSMFSSAIRLGQWISGADFDAVRPIDLMARVKSPMMVIHAGNDPFAPEADARQMQSVMKTRSENGMIGEFWNIEGAAHVMGVVADPEEYQRRIRAFLDGVPQGSRAPNLENV